MGNLVTQPFEVNDFSGGITDHTFTSSPTKAKVLDNFVLLSNKTPITRPGSVVDDLVNGQIPAGAQRIGTLINYDNSANLFVQSAKKIYYRNPSAYTTITGPSGNDVFSAGSTSSVVSYSQWNKQVFLTSDSYPIPMKIYKDSGGVIRVRDAGLPFFANAPTVTAGAAGAMNFIYAFHYEYTYTVGSQTFIDAGPISFVELNNSADPSISPNAITNIPVLSNGATHNWDTATIKIPIYRTIDGGTELFKIGEVTNGTTVFNDNFADTAIENNELIYNSDGSQDNDPPPLSKFIHIVNNIGYYGYLKEGSSEFPFRIRQSIPGDPDSVPADFELEVEDDITGISSVQSIPIVLCKRYIYRIEGQYDQFGRGFMSYVRISDTAGCVANSSLVQAENGLFWAGNDGFYYTDGYRVSKISDDNNQNYMDMLAQSANSKRIYGKFDELQRRIYWGLQTDSASLDNDTIFALDLRYGVQNMSVFTTWSGENNFRPTSLEFFGGKLYRADSRGYVFKHDPIYLTDPKVDTGAIVSLWTRATIIWSYRSVAFNFGQNFVRKFVPRMLLTASNQTNVSIQINAINDDGKSTRPLKEIRWRRNFVWGAEDFVWNDPNCIWNSEGLIEQWRRLPAGGLRISYIQIEVTNALTIITNSDTIGTATFNGTTNQLTLDDAAASDWPLESVDYFISTEADGYDKLYLVTVRTNDTLTVADSDNTLPNGSLKWIMRGYKKGEILNLLSYTLHWANISKTQATYESGQDGGNAT